MVDIHPELQSAARFLPRSPVGPTLVKLLRVLMRPGRTPALPRNAAGVEVTDHSVSVPGAPATRLRLYRPSGGSRPVPAVVWLHGGGYVIGMPEQDEASHIELVRGLGVAVASVAYRLAPEHPHPAALDDATACLRFVHDTAAALGVDATRIVLAGVSAGGGLAAATALRARDDGGPRVALQVLIYPMLDDRTITRSDIDPRPHRIWSVPSNAFAWRAYVGPAAGSDTVDVRAVPSRRADLTGLPAAWIGVGTADLFHDEDTTYGARLRAAGVPCALHVVQGGFHAFDVAVRAAPVSRAFRAAWQEAIARAIAPA